MSTNLQVGTTAITTVHTVLPNHFMHVKFKLITTL